MANTYKKVDSLESGTFRASLSEGIIFALTAGILSVYSVLVGRVALAEDTLTLPKASVNKTSDAQSVASADIVVLGIDIDSRGGIKWDIAQIGFILKPILGFARFGIGTTTLSIYYPKKKLIIKKISVELENTPIDSSSWENFDYGAIYGLFPIKAYFVPIVWKTWDILLGSIYFYYDFWPIRMALGATEFKSDYKLAKSASIFHEAGIGINPIGGLISVKGFYRQVSISSGTKYYTPGGCAGGPAVAYCSSEGKHVYRFLGYKESIWGVTLSIYLGLWKKGK